MNCSFLVRIGFLVAILWFPATWAMDKNSPEHYLDGSITPAHAHAGDTVVIRWIIDSDKSCVGIVQRKLVDAGGVVYDFLPKGTDTKAGERQVELTREIILPLGMAPGRATYHAEFSWMCNPFQRLFWPLLAQTPELYFTIDPSPTLIPH